MDLCWSHQTKKKHFLLPKLTQVGVDGDKVQVRLSCPVVFSLCSDCVRLSIITKVREHKTNKNNEPYPSSCADFSLVSGSDWLSALGSAHLDWPLQLWLLIAEPHHPDDCHGDAEPVEETEEVYDGEDVIGEGVEQCHQAL